MQLNKLQDLFKLRAVIFSELDECNRFCGFSPGTEVLELRLTAKQLFSLPRTYLHLEAWRIAVEMQIVQINIQLEKSQPEGRVWHGISLQEAQQELNFEIAIVSAILNCER